MEIPQLGKYCCENNCNTLDFLPFTCKCGDVFCSEHFNNHLLYCATSEAQSQVEPHKDTKAKYICCNESCNERSYIALICDGCNKHFCVLHRHVVGCSEEGSQERAAKLEKFNAPLRNFNEVKSKVDKELTAVINAARSKPKTSKMANKIQLMRIKGRASGLKTIPVNDRVYFNIYSLVTSNKQELPVFVSKTWSLGRAIDAVAMELKLDNRNNQSTALKLRLFHKDTGKILSPNLSDTIDTLLSKSSLLDGEDLILEYVDNECLVLEVL